MRKSYSLGVLAVVVALTGSPAMAQEFYAADSYDYGPGYGYSWGNYPSSYGQDYYPTYYEGSYPAYVEGSYPAYVEESYPGYDNGYYYGNYSYGPFGAAAGVVGGAVETAGAIATAPFRAFGVRESYAMAQGGSHCAERYRSYNPASGTFMGYDGRRHPCR